MSVNINEMPKLGFGLMRLPETNGKIDLDEVCRMVDLYMDAGLNYFDTAYVYHGGKSEVAAKKAIVERYPRDSFKIATKLPAWEMKTEADRDRIFNEQLERAGVDYYDFYLLHSVENGNIDTYERLDCFNWGLQKKAEGKIKHIGFSFHSGPELLDKILTEHPEAEFVQLQINYADWENPDVQSRANYEVARKHGKWITVMEPVKGGNLANPPKEVQDLFKAYAPEMSCASWAIRFVASLDGILTVLSGMSNIPQMEDNISYMKDFQPLNAEEREIIRKAQRILGQSATIPCTACHYCTKGCPMQIPIPEIFAAQNDLIGNGQTDQAREVYRKLAGAGHVAADCIGCGQCEGVCPQHIQIIGKLKECAASLE